MPHYYNNPYVSDHSVLLFFDVNKWPANSMSELQALILLTRLSASVMMLLINAKKLDEATYEVHNKERHFSGPSSIV